MKRLKMLIFCLIGMIFLLSAPALADTGKVTLVLRPEQGTVSKTKITRTAGGTYGKLPTPVREGYTFLGWFTKKTGGEAVTAKTVLPEVSRQKLFARWEVEKYAISYVYHGGKLASWKTNPETYTVEDTIRLKSPARTGYVFKGWFTTPKFKTGTRIISIKPGMTGDLTVYAKFMPITYTIRFIKNDVLESAPKKMVCTYGKKVQLPGSEEVSFASWNTMSDGTGTKYEAGQTVKNLTKENGAVITLYAYAFKGNNNIEKLYEYFQRIGYTKEASAAIVGNLMYESGGGYNDVKLNAVEWSTGRGIGMCQWTDTYDMSRRTNFEKFCISRKKPWPNQDLKVQVDFLLGELSGTYGKVWYFLQEQGYPANYKMTFRKFKKLKDVELAVAVFCANFERPRPEHANLAQRTAYARSVMSRYESVTP